MAKAFLKQSSITYEVVEVEENEDLVSLYGVRSVPTLVVKYGSECKQYVNASNIRYFVESSLKK